MSADDPQHAKLNTISHRDLPACARAIAELYRRHSGPEGEALVEEIEEDLREYESLLKRTFATPLSHLVNDLDRDRYVAFEAFVDALDDIVNVDIADRACLIHSYMHMSLDEALLLLEDYAAAVAIFGRNEENRGRLRHYSFASSEGHDWHVDAMQAFIGRAHDPAVREHARKAKVLQLLEALTTADTRLEQALAGQEAEDLRESLDSVRKKRARLTPGIHLLRMRLPGSKPSHKKTRILQAHTLFKDRFVAQEEARQLEKFSLNELSSTAFLKIADTTARALEKNSDIAEGLRSKFTESYRLYSHAVASARAWEGWEELDTCETERLRGLEELLFSLTSNYNCICNGDKTIWDEHTRTPQHQAALALYESLENCAYDSLAMFERGESIHPRRQENMLEAWSSPVNLAHLESLGCTALFEQCRQRDRLARLLDDRMRREGIDATLDTLRNQRGYLTAALNVLDRRLREG